MNTVGLHVMNTVGLHVMNTVGLHVMNTVGFHDMDSVLLCTALRQMVLRTGWPGESKRA
ncbi:MAG: hypothetical protein HOM69_01965 [Gammaproteobacteria bacterium]|jgi:hypothetical protein|nr:hypothetical protein [Gammaproteobacteria bacterium]